MRLDTSRHLSPSHFVNWLRAATLGDATLISGTQGFLLIIVHLIGKPELAQSILVMLKVKWH